MNDGEKVDDLGQHDKRVPDLNKVLALQAHHQGLGNLVMPLVAHVPKKRNYLSPKPLGGLVYIDQNVKFYELHFHILIC